MVEYRGFAFLHFETLPYLILDAVGTMTTNEYEKSIPYASADQLQDADSDVVAQTRVEVHTPQYSCTGKVQKG